MSEKWIPPEDMSTISSEILAQIPEKYHYWMAEDPEVLRIKLMEAIREGQVVIKLPILPLDLDTEALKLEKEKVERELEVKTTQLDLVIKQKKLQLLNKLLEEENIDQAVS